MAYISLILASLVLNFEAKESKHFCSDDFDLEYNDLWLVNEDHLSYFGHLINVASLFDTI